MLEMVLHITKRWPWFILNICTEHMWQNLGRIYRLFQSCNQQNFPDYKDKNLIYLLCKDNRRWPTEFAHLQSMTEWLSTCIALHCVVLMFLGGFVADYIDLSPPTLYVGHTATCFKSHLPVLQAFCCNSTIEPFYLACRSNLNCTTAIAIIATTAKCYVLCHGAHVYSIGPTSMH